MFRQVIVVSLASLFSAPCVHGADNSRPELVSTTGGKGDGAWNSVEEIQKAADAGDPAACYELGEMYLAGKQVPLDVAKAVGLLERAADAGNANAAFRLGKLNADGEVIPKNLPQAFERYQAAANAGVAEAQFNLGAMYASGRGVKRDYVEGLAWLIVAAKNGADPEGEKQLRDHLTKARRTATIAEAEKRAVTRLNPSGEPKAAEKSGEKTTGSPSAPTNAPAVARPDAKVKLDGPAAPGRIQITPPAPGGLSMPVIPPPPPKISPPPPPSPSPTPAAPAAQGK